MARVPAATRESVPQHHQQAFDAVVQSRGGIPRTDPGSIMIHSPEASRRASHLSDYLRRESTLPSHVQELAMLVTARELDCQYIWNAHAAAGKKAGLRPELVDALREKRPLPVTACNPNGPGLQSAQVWDHIHCNYRPLQDRIQCTRACNPWRQDHIICN